MARRRYPELVSKESTPTTRRSTTPRGRSSTSGVTCRRVTPAGARDCRGWSAFGSWRWPCWRSRADAAPGDGPAAGPRSELPAELVRGLPTSFPTGLCLLYNGPKHSISHPLLRSKPLPTSQPIIKKFFTNKIQSTEASWPDYLLEVADVFSRFDGTPYDRDAITEEFQNISDRGPYVLRDPSDFRDEYSAYASFLGLAYVARDGADWVTRLTEASRMYLCSTEPDPEAFCRIQLSLFQYPAGQGVRYSSEGRPSAVQANVLNDTVREVEADVRLVPLRVILRAILALVDRGQDPAEITLNFSTIYRIFNTPAIFQDPTPSNSSLLSAIDDSSGQSGVSGANLGHFKRNFHILEQTGLLRRTADRNALQLQLENNGNSVGHSLRMCRAIAKLETFYDGFEECANSAGLRQSVRDKILSLEWGAFFDGGNLPVNVLSEVAGTQGRAGDMTDYPLDSVHTSSLPDFPPLVVYNPTSTNPRPAPLIGLEAPGNPEQRRVLREKANRSHARIVQLLASTARAGGLEPRDNLYIDLYLGTVPLIIEVKSCNAENMLSQVRRGISQLYEYRYRSGIHDARLCLALEQEPSGQDHWLVSYLLEDRDIYPLWLVGDVTLDGPPQTRDALRFLFP